MKITAWASKKNSQSRLPTALNNIFKPFYFTEKHVWILYQKIFIDKGLYLRTV